ncbi:MAG TPA: membrane-binding protein [Lutibacter sp.]|nr:membrane-binding protein [Lutibacter sp.]
MKTLINIVVMLFCITAFSQEQKVTYQKMVNDLVKATYYFADNSDVVEREGYFNKEGKLHDTWISYDLQGNKTAIATYNNGVKEGVWTYIKTDKITVVTYNKNKIIHIEEKALVVN